MITKDNFILHYDFDTSRVSQSARLTDMIGNTYLQFIGQEGVDYDITDSGILLYRNSVDKGFHLVRNNSSIKLYDDLGIVYRTEYTPFDLNFINLFHSADISSLNIGNYERIWVGPENMVTFGPIITGKRSITACYFNKNTQIKAIYNNKTFTDSINYYTPTDIDYISVGKHRTGNGYGFKGIIHSISILKVDGFNINDLRNLYDLNFYDILNFEKKNYYLFPSIKSINNENPYSYVKSIYQNQSLENNDLVLLNNNGNLETISNFNGVLDHQKYKIEKCDEEFYVDPNNGEDSELHDGSQQKPFKTLQYLLENRLETNYYVLSGCSFEANKNYFIINTIPNDFDIDKFLKSTSTYVANYNYMSVGNNLVIGYEYFDNGTKLKVFISGTFSSTQTDQYITLCKYYNIYCKRGTYDLTGYQITTPGINLIFEPESLIKSESGDRTFFYYVYIDDNNKYNTELYKFAFPARIFGFPNIYKNSYGEGNNPMFYYTGNRLQRPFVDVVIEFNTAYIKDSGFISIYDSQLCSVHIKGKKYECYGYDGYVGGGICLGYVEFVKGNLEIEHVLGNVNSNFINCHNYVGVVKINFLGQNLGAGASLILRGSIDAEILYSQGIIYSVWSFFPRDIITLKGLYHNYIKIEYYDGLFNLKVNQIRALEIYNSSNIYVYSNLIGWYGHCIINNCTNIRLYDTSLFDLNLSNSNNIFLEKIYLRWSNIINSRVNFDDIVFISSIYFNNSEVHLKFNRSENTIIYSQTNLDIPTILANYSKIYVYGYLKTHYNDPFNTLPINYRSGEAAVFHIGATSEIYFIDFTYETNFLTLARFYYHNNQYPKVIIDRLTLSASHIYEQQEDCYVFSTNGLSTELVPVHSRNIDLVYTSKYIESENRHVNIFNKVKFYCELNLYQFPDNESTMSFNTKLGDTGYTSTESTPEARAQDFVNQINSGTTQHGVEATLNGTTIILRAVTFDGSYLYLYHSNSYTMTVIKHNYPGINIIPLENHIKYTT